MMDQTPIPDPEALRLEAQAWVVRFRSGIATSADTAELLQWRARSPEHARALAEAIAVRRLIAAASGESDVPVLSGMAGSASSRSRTGVGRTALGRRAFLGGAVAASAASLLMTRPPFELWSSLSELRADYRTGVGERRTIALANGATVELNTRTSASLLPSRETIGLDLISGEVAIDATHASQPVAIHTPAGTARGQGGRFAVRLEAALSCVTCLAGVVDIENAWGGREKASAGYQLRYTDRNFHAATRVDLGRAEAWRRGLLMFVDEPLSRVVEEVNRYRPGRIVVVDDHLGHVLINAVFQLDRINTVVAQIRDVSNAHVTSLPGGIVLLS